jgi:hypothetical protein
LKTKYLATIALAIAISTIFLAAPAQAQIPETVNIYAHTTKPYYSPGDKGILHIEIRNDRTDQDLILHNITIMYPWFAYLNGKWEGNDTILISPAFVLSKEGATVYSTDVEFTIPTDGRITSMSATTIYMEIAVDKAPFAYSETILIYVKSTPYFMSLEEMDRAVMWLMVLVILGFLGMLIIAGAIYLSARRPQVMWRHEEGKET